MRILIFYQYFCTPKGAWGTRWYEFARRLVARGHQVTLLTSLYDKSDLSARGFLTKLNIEGIDVRLLNIRLSNKHGFARRVLSFFSYSLAACSFALLHRCDLVLASSGPITVGLPGLLARFLRHKPLVFEVRDLWPEGAIQLGILRGRLAIFLARTLEKWCYRGASGIVALSPGMREWIVKRSPGVAVEVIPNGSDLDLAGDAPILPMPEWAQGKKLLVYAGTLGLIDAVGQLLDWAEWLQECGNQNYHVVIIGEGRERVAIEKERTRRGLHQVHLLGQIPRFQVFSWLKAAFASLFVVQSSPFLHTASPNKIFDAFAVGVPLLQTTSGWIAELVRVEACGVNLLRPDAAALLQALHDLENNHERYRANSARLGATLFARDQLADRYENLLKSLV